ncbi:MAG: TonB-dependent receptor [Bacteroidota bacterium]|nr:TonB-dependent receptor [Bacteroidota bacterium]
MKKLMFLIILPVFALQPILGQQLITGTVKDKNSQEPLSGVEVKLQGAAETVTDENGAFRLTSEPNKDHTIIFLLGAYSEIEKQVSVKTADIDLGVVFMQPATNDMEDVVIELSTEELDSEYGGLETNLSGVLHGSKDIFMSTAGYNFGPMRFKMRGYDGRYTSLHMNGIQTNDPESGRAVWAYWGGLNDAVRNKVSEKGITNNDLGFGGVGGYTSISTRASRIQTGTKLTYSFSNRNYHHRAMFLYSSGMMENGLAIAVSGSRRYAQEGYTEGTFYDAYAYFASVEKKINDKHSIGLVTFGAPSRRGGRSATTQEVYDLAGTTYNPNWGWYEDQKRNARISDGYTPMTYLTHYWDISSKSSLKTSLMYSNGKYNKTSLNWYSAKDPRPDYYRYLPSYMDGQDAIDRRTTEFENGERQLDWEAMYQVNLASYDEIFNADGIAGNTVSGLRSEYIIENRRNENNQYKFNTVYSNELNDNLKLVAGIKATAYYGRHYKTLYDLMGGDYVLDIDKYAERDLVGEDVADNDLNHPNHIVDTIGEVFGNDYNSTVQNAQLWAQVSYSKNNFDFYLGGYGSYTEFWRTGNMKTGKFPENSFGDSEKLDFMNYGAKFGAKYKVSGMHYFHADAAYLTKAPYFRNAFVSPRSRNQTVDGLTDETIMSGQVGYVIQGPKLKATFDAFYTEFNGQSKVRSFYFDGYHNFVNFVMTGIDKTHQGLEAGIEYKVLPGLSIYGVGSVGYYRWTSRPEFSVYVDNSADVKYDHETVYVENFLVSGTPQTAASVGFKYFAPGYWWIGVNGNYLADRYLPFSALTRTIDAVALIDHSSDDFKQLTEQERLPESFTMNAFLGKSFRFDYKYYLSISLNITNVLDDRSIITGGYEQGRIDASYENLEKFPPKYYYFSGMQYYLNINFRF